MAMRTTILLVFILGCCFTPLLSRSFHHRVEQPEETEKLLKVMPKIEMHAHLHGSIRRSTLEELSKARNLGLDCEWDKESDSCFSLFNVVYEVIRSKEILRRIILEVFEDFMKDNVIYLELRTTPRSLPDDSTTHVGK